MSSLRLKPEELNQYPEAARIVDKDTFDAAIAKLLRQAPTPMDTITNKPRKARLPQGTQASRLERKR